MERAVAAKDFDGAITIYFPYRDAKDQQLDALADHAYKKRGERYAAEERSRAKKEGVAIGMTKEQVLGSMWGKPRRVHSTTNAFGTREQWVYGDGNYLYFQDGILTSIQN